MSFIELLKVILLGIVEGITEWRPISSTGHMILVDEFIKLNVSDAAWRDPGSCCTVLEQAVAFLHKKNPEKNTDGTA